MHRVSPSSLVALALALATATPACLEPRTRGTRAPVTSVADTAHLLALATAIQAVEGDAPATVHASAPAEALEILPMEEGPIDPAAVESAVERWNSLPADSTLLDRIPETLRLTQLVLVAENDVARARGTRRAQLFALERLYSALDRPQLADPRNSTSSIIIDALEGMIGPSEDHRKSTAIVGLLFSTLRSSAPLHRWTAAEIVRSFPDDPATIEVIERLATALDAHGRHDLALQAKASAVDLRGPAATVPHRLALAQACYRALAFDRGDRVLATARTLAAGGFRTELADVTQTRADAVRLEALADARSIAARLERARVMQDLDRSSEAELELEALVREHPRNARVRHGLARFHLRAHLDYAAAYRVVADAPDALERRDRSWHQLAFATRGVHLLHTFVRDGRRDLDAFAVLATPVLAAMRAEATALVALSDPSAEALHLAVDLVEDGGRLAIDDRGRELPVWLGGRLSRALAVLDQRPDDPLAYDIALASAALSRDRVAAFSMLERAVPDDAKNVRAANRVRLALGLAVAWQDDARLPALLHDVDALPTETDPQIRTTLRADIELVRWRRTADASAAERAIEGYTSLVESGVTDARIRENLAVLLAHDREASRAIWTRIVEENPDDSDLARVHLATSYEPPDLEALERIAGEDEGLAGRVAMQWLVELAPTARERRRWRGAVARLRAATAAVEPGGDLLPERGGLALANEFDGGIGYVLDTEAVTVRIELARYPRAFVVPTRFVAGRRS